MSLTANTVSQWVDGTSLKKKKSQREAGHSPISIRNTCFLYFILLILKFTLIFFLTLYYHSLMPTKISMSEKSDSAWPDSIHRQTRLTSVSRRSLDGINFPTLRFLCAYNFFVRLGGRNERAVPATCSNSTSKVV